MKSILRLGYIVIIMILIGCNRINHVKHENNTSSRSSLSEALLSQEDNALKPEEAVPFSTTVDSVKIVLWNLAEMEFHVYPNVAGYACMESDTIVLSRQYCQIVLNTIDTLFMKKIIPVVETITWQKMATCMDSHPYYYIHVYHNGKCYKRRISYVSNSGQYEYKFSNMFTFMADSTMNIMNQLYVWKRERNRQDPKKWDMAGIAINYNLIASKSMSLRRNIIPIVSLPFIGLVSGCQHSNNTGNSVPSIDPTLPGVSSGWVIGHKEKKSFGFISNYCVVDTLNVTDTFRDEKGSLISPGDSAGRISGYSFVINREYSRMHGSLFVGEENDSLQIRAVLHLRHTGIGDTISPIPLRPEDYTLYGRTFKDCIVIDSLNSCYSGQPAEGVRNKITTYVFSKEFGLIYYRFEDGEEFHRWDL